MNKAKKQIQDLIDQLNMLREKTINDADIAKVNEANSLIKTQVIIAKQQIN